jgi:hypothetical protein
LKARRPARSGDCVANRLAETAQTAQEFYDKMLALCPNRMNPGCALWSSARAVNRVRF